MPDRRPFLSLLAAFLWLATLSDPARAHRLEAEHHVLPGRRVQVESWFDATGEPPRNATVQVFREDGGLMTEGRLDERGIFVFPYAEAIPLRVVVSAGAGHRKEFRIPANDLEGDGPAGPTGTAGLPRPAGPTGSPGPLSDRTSRVSVKDVLIGVGFLLAVASFALGVRNARRLRELQARARQGGAG